MHGLDAWLEAPYVDAARRQDEVERFAEANDLPLETDADRDAAYQALEDFASDQEDDAAIARAEYDRDYPEDW